MPAILIIFSIAGTKDLTPEIKIRRCLIWLNFGDRGGSLHHQLPPRQKRYSKKILKVAQPMASRSSEREKGGSSKGDITSKAGPQQHASSKQAPLPKSTFICKLIN